MILTDSESKKASVFNSLAKKLFSSGQLPDSLCLSCRGTGLSNCYNNSDGSSSWDGISYCDNCKGVGYTIENIIKKVGAEYFICDKCNGMGSTSDNVCKACNGKGILNWLERIFIK